MKNKISQIQPKKIKQEYNVMKNKISHILPKKIKYAPFVVVLVSIIIYYPTIFGAFVLDDVTYFVKNDILTKLSIFDFKEIVTVPSNYWGELLPLRDYLYVLEYNWFGTNPIGYHFISILIFIAAAFVLYFWIKELSFDFLNQKGTGGNHHYLSKIGGLAGMSFFLLNPIYVESVAYISGQKDILSVFFVLLSLLFLYRAGKTSSNTFWILLGLGTFIHYLAVLSKLSAVSTIIFVPFLWMLISPLKKNELLKKSGIWLLLNIPVILWIGYLSKLGSPSLLSTPFLERIARAINILGIYIDKMIWPWPLSFGYPFDPIWSLDIFFILGLIFVTLCIVLFFKREKYPWLLLSFLFVGIYLLPVLQIYPEMMNSQIFDRYLALPMIGFFLLIVFSLLKLINFWPHRQNAILLGIVSLLILWSSFTIQYLPTFKNNIASTKNTFNLFPNWNTAPFNYAYALIEDGQYEMAMEFVVNEKSFERPSWVKPYFLGWIFLREGEDDKAYQLLSEAFMITHYEGYFPFADIYLAETMIKRGQLKKARQLLVSINNQEIKNPLYIYDAKEFIKEIDSLELLNINEKR